MRRGKKVNKKKMMRTAISAILCATLAVSAGASASINTDAQHSVASKKVTKVSVPEDRIYITNTKYTLVPGVTENVLTTNNEAGTNQRIGFLMDVQSDAYTGGDVKIVACYKD